MNLNNEFLILLVTAANIGFFHTLFGPDHYLPFVVMSKARNWSKKKTLIITALCGTGHVLSSIVIGFIGISIGTVVSKLEILESWRGNLAAWLFIIFGFLYMMWGIKQAIKGAKHSHFHSHGKEHTHSHEHSHTTDHVHVHDHICATNDNATKQNSLLNGAAEANETNETNETNANITPWILFTIFLFGPCEPLIPVLMYPAAKGHFIHIIAVALIFAIVTISTMTAVVYISITSTASLKFKTMEKYSHALAGATICCSGLAIQFLGL